MYDDIGVEGREAIRPTDALHTSGEPSQQKVRGYTTSRKAAIGVGRKDTCKCSRIARKRLAKLARKGNKKSRKDIK